MRRRSGFDSWSLRKKILVGSFALILGVFLSLSALQNFNEDVFQVILAAAAAVALAVFVLRDLLPPILRAETVQNIAAEPKQSNINVESKRIDARIILRRSYWLIVERQFGGVATLVCVGIQSNASPRTWAYLPLRLRLVSAERNDATDDGVTMPKAFTDEIVVEVTKSQVQDTTRGWSYEQRENIRFFVEDVRGERIFVNSSRKISANTNV